mmetsp:Transcript_9296/g.13822  ORF Transcript_9296/g.13822 Transcript_9296/m.13822 type:complete len:284 (+) Transcript_9296:194-1045(+)|eukprot:CAMPEP_0203655840 /NCGR_PEP_ID=MMETSP0088-20131115/39488_1 /ASSEMBLY_ACC=CAM_ASM_001087 /TAXON_ID=426623 /ORGANISM="Chaetoceros affinis, Strain CCMP159" /LENGTH=283 /DNA_ID=CAMNT_0050516589 /DNA_START=87 /DNA_END=938 /DNA_ORIENTATION=-
MSSTTSRRIIQTSIKSIAKKPSSNCCNNAIQKQQQRFMSKNIAIKTGSSSSSSNNNKLIQYSILTAGIVTLVSATAANNNVPNGSSKDTTTFCDYIKKTGGEIVMLGPTKEGSTGILFPHLCNGLQFVGCGVRVKYGFIKVYAVGTYMDPIAMSAVKSRGPKAISEALLNPTYPRTIRIVMNRSLSIEKYTAAIVEALEPRMNGEDMDKLEEFKNLNPPIDLVEGAEMEMTIRGNVMLYKNSIGGVGQIESEVFCKALCDVYYGDEAVSPGHKEQVLKGVAAM